ncbi:MAG: MBL fold metallo-hydrolase [Gammaproteobacteria bacterium]|nr:MBL fold metallo-hydrolase [Gammaproteobacteria bacterium]
MFEHGVPHSLNSRVRRVVAPNPGVMTGPGTNTYLLGTEAVAVLDPGPLIDEHVEAILAAADGKIRWIVATHTHPDHSPAWQPLQEATGAEVIGAKPWDDMFQDDTFAPGVEVTHDYLLQTDEFTLRAIHTPGHVGNHYCFLLEEEGMLFTGDHIMQGSTVVIVPPSGDMRAYIDSLKLLLDYPIKSLAPGHGSVIEDPEAAVNWLVDHRLKREQKVVDGLQQLREANLDELVLVVYDDVDSGLHSMAKLSMTAHLIKLQQDGRVQCSDQERWSLI